MCLSFEAIIVSAQFPSAFFLMHCQRTASLTAAFSGNLHHFNAMLWCKGCFCGDAKSAQNKFCFIFFSRFQARYLNRET